MTVENRQRVTDEPVTLENQPVEGQDFRKFTEESIDYTSNL